MKVYLDAGHGGRDSGAVGIGGRKEKDDAQRLTDLVANKLKGSGIAVVVNTDVNQTLRSVVDQANSENVDLFISMHRNAYSDPNANGLEVWICPNARELTKRNANLVYDKLVKVAPMKARGVKDARFYVLTQTISPAMLIELGFVTNVVDNTLFDQNVDNYADEIVSGIKEIFGVNHQYIVQVGVYGTLAQANIVLADLKNKGYTEAEIV